MFVPQVEPQTTDTIERTRPSYMVNFVVLTTLAPKLFPNNGTHTPHARTHARTHVHTVGENSHDYFLPDCFPQTWNFCCFSVSALMYAEVTQKLSTFPLCLRDMRLSPITPSTYL